MAIILKCSKCQEQLEVDDAFAGGICRCVHCGALSHVPLQSTRVDKKGRPLTPPQMARPVIASAEEEQNLVIAQAREYVAARKRRGLLAIVMMLMALAMAGAAVLLLVKLFGQPDDTGPGVTDTVPLRNVFTDTSGPNFAGLAIKGGSVAYLVNTGSSMRDIIDGVRGAVVLSAKSLEQTRYAVIGWSKPAQTFMGETTPGEPPAAWPETGLASPGADLAPLGDFLADLQPAGAKDPLPAVEAALDRNVEAILLITHFDLDAAQADAIRAKLAGKNVTVYAVLIGDDEPAQLRKLAGDDSRVKRIGESELFAGLRDAPSP